MACGGSPCGCFPGFAPHGTDPELGRPSIVGGASVYPMTQNFCLPLRDQGVATTFTTLLVAREPQVRELLEIPRAGFRRGFGDGRWRNWRSSTRSAHR
jgi:hypothetical protein